VIFVSVVNIIFAMEVMGVLLLVIDALDLNGRVEEPVLATAQVGHGGQSLEGLLGLNVHSHGELALRDRPQVHVVEVHDVALVLLPDVLLEVVGVDVFRRALHENHQTVFDCRVRGDENHDGEAVSANRVEPPKVRAEVYYCGSGDDSATHEHVT